MGLKFVLLELFTLMPKRRAVKLYKAWMGWGRGRNDIEEGSAVGMDYAKKRVNLKRPFGKIHTIEFGSAQTHITTHTYSNISTT